MNEARLLVRNDPSIAFDDRELKKKLPPLQPIRVADNLTVHSRTTVPCFTLRASFNNPNASVVHSRNNLTLSEEIPMFPRFSVSLEMRKRFLVGSCALAGLSLVVLGVFAKNGWLPSTDPFTGTKTGWFGKQLAKNAPSSWNPLAALLPTPTPTPLPLSKEYVYAGSRLLAVEDANANAALPSDLAIWRPSSGAWWVLSGASNGTYSTYYGDTWGSGGNPSANPPVPSDKPEPGDYDGDGKTDFAVFRPSTGYWWILQSSSGSQYSFQFGIASDKPAPADYDGDGRTDPAFFRPDDPSVGTGTFHIIRSSNASYYAVPFGLTADTPAPADFDGDGKADLAVWRGSSSVFYSSNSSNGNLSYFEFRDSSNQLISSTEPVPADYDGDGRADYAVRQSGSSDWIIRNSQGGTTSTIPWQTAGDIAVQNDYDADGKCDIAVWRAATGYWYIRPSTSSGIPRAVQWGMNGDIPVPAFYRR